MASARARLMTAVDLTLTVQGDDPDAPIVHEVQGPGGVNDIFEVRQDVRFYLQISRIQNLVADIAEKTVIKTYTLATGGPAYGVEIRYADCEGHGEVDEVLFWYQDWFTEKAYYSVPDGMQGLVLDVLGVEY